MRCSADNLDRYYCTWLLAAKSPHTIMPITQLMHPIALLAAPHLGAQVRALLADTGAIETISSNDGFLRVSHGASEGYLPAALCNAAALPAIAGELQQTAVSQPVLLYARPVPGPAVCTRCWQKRASVAEFSLTKCLGCLDAATASCWYSGPAGRLGYVPAELVRAALPLEIARSNPAPLDAFWIGLGFGGALLNWSGLFGLMFTLSVPETARPYFALVLLLAAVSALWFSPRRLYARSLAVGALLGYGAIHIASNGWLTFWRV